MNKGNKLAARVHGNLATGKGAQWSKPTDKNKLPSLHTNQSGHLELQKGWPTNQVTQHTNQVRPIIQSNNPSNRSNCTNNQAKHPPDLIIFLQLYFSDTLLTCCIMNAHFALSTPMTIYPTPPTKITKPVSSIWNLTTWKRLYHDKEKDLKST